MNYNPLNDLIKRVKSGCLEELATMYYALLEFDSISATSSLISAAVDEGIKFRSDEDPQLMALKYDSKYWLASPEDRKLVCQLVNMVRQERDSPQHSLGDSDTIEKCKPTNLALNGLICLLYLNEIDYSSVLDELIPGWTYAYSVCEPATIDIFMTCDKNPGEHSFDGDRIHIVHLFKNETSGPSHGKIFGRRVIYNILERSATIKHIANSQISAIYRELKSSDSKKYTSDYNYLEEIISRLMKDESGLPFTGCAQNIEGMKLKALTPGITIKHAACADMYSYLDALCRSGDSGVTDFHSDLTASLLPIVHEALQIHNRFVMTNLKKEILTNPDLKLKK